MIRSISLAFAMTALTACVSVLPNWQRYHGYNLRAVQEAGRSQNAPAAAPAAAAAAPAAAAAGATLDG